jgi:hypothetical protein
VVSREPLDPSSSSSETNDPVNYEPELLAASISANVAATEAAEQQAEELIRTRPLPADFKLSRKAETIGAVFVRADQYVTDAEKVAWLRHNDTAALRYFLQLAYDAHVEWLMPPGLPPFVPFVMKRNGRVIPLKPGHAPTELLCEMRRLYLFTKGGGDSLNQLKREKIFQEIIEGMEAVEVDLLLSVKDKRFQASTYHYGVSREVVNTAFNGLLNTPTRLKFLGR